MARYAALLRGVNVGTTRLPMADLRRVVADLGHEDVRTYLQSGNVVFTSPPRKDDILAQGIERRLADELGVRVPVLVRGHDELAAIVDAGPYAKQQDDPTRLLVAFLSAKPTAAKVKDLAVPAGENIEYAVVGREIHLHLPDGGYGRTKFTNAYLEKKLGVVATTRNWKSVLALRDLAAG
ncbi:MULTISPECIES: DUF1697 domain-containing protein [Micromonospora]|uniref:DUF1697 domain-containing protein n=1 Tax=Micromonospora solifontis TaxID=2487138 RepID=A0ABX9WIU4_9ACTN|nr:MULTISPECIES: DUF1697 domain-containing protein [Micromonospora]NES15184.1 DUF1697 domain-containing protein [Micromonospora sp. PPF5-17B]NES36809.1 DUF1697 domain-containing protein [Micromonospora solifontis]NES56519.1 DUF1697 domain-containing protein [Micromonospora sp. PPF5-6]RNL99002.1 DUF1697 domain-containing protein [Micromonospora solifontis]